MCTSSIFHGGNESEKTKNKHHATLLGRTILPAHHLETGTMSDLAGDA
jgi:hypothetical protein